MNNKSTKDIIRKLERIQGIERRLNLMIICFIPFLLLSSLLGVCFISLVTMVFDVTFFDGFMTYLALAYISIWAIQVAMLLTSKCPSCNEFFYGGTWFKDNRCKHCGMNLSKLKN